LVLEYWLKDYKPVPVFRYFCHLPKVFKIYDKPNVCVILTNYITGKGVIYDKYDAAFNAKEKKVYIIDRTTFEKQDAKIQEIISEIYIAHKTNNTIRHITLDAETYDKYMPKSSDVADEKERYITIEVEVIKIS